MKTLPITVKPHKRTATFTEATAPQGLLTDHTTKAGTWAVITVVSGQLQYTIPSQDEIVLLDPETPGIVEPEVPHRIKPLGPVMFHLEFWR